MISVLFVCLGNICRSPMAESLFSYRVKEAGLSDKIFVSSAATSTEELGNPPHRGTLTVLKKYGIPLVPHRARQLTVRDGERFDYLVGMDLQNVRGIRRIVGENHAEKARMLLDFTDSPREIADPWYTGDFDAAYRDIAKGTQALLDEIRKKYGW